jgi:hypothetical protein
VELPAAERYTRAQIHVIRIVVPVVTLFSAILKAYYDVGVPDLEFRPILHFAVTAGIAAITFFMVGLLICGAVFRRRVAVTELV